MLGQELCQNGTGQGGRRWHGEPRVEDLLNDPVMRLVMRRDHVQRDDLARLIREIRESLRQA